MEFLLSHIQPVQELIVRYYYFFTKYFNRWPVNHSVFLACGFWFSMKCVMKCVENLEFLGRKILSSFLHTLASFKHILCVVFEEVQQKFKCISRKCTLPFLEMCLVVCCCLN